MHAVRIAKHSFGLRVLHWLTVLLVTAQFIVGYAMAGAEGVLEPWIESAYDGDEDLLLPVHAVIGTSLLAVTLVRLIWRQLSTLPPWPDGMSPAEQRFAHRTEVALYTLLFAVPLSGLALLFISGEDFEVSDRGEWQAPWDLVDDDLLVAAHVAGQILLLITIALHVGLVVKRQRSGDRFVRRML